MTKIKLVGEQLDDELVLGYNSQNGAQKDKNGKEFRVLIHDSIPFTVPESVFTEWKSGKLQSMNLIRGTRDVPNTDEEGNEIDGTHSVDTLTYSGSATTEQVLARKSFNAECYKIENSFKVTGSLADAI